MSLPSKQIRDTTRGETKRRSAVKALTWRVLATIDTAIISYLLTGSVKIAVSIGVFENIVKIIIYFFHERLWNIIKWGKSTMDSNDVRTDDVKIRSIIKAVSWSIIGVVTTITIAYILTVPIKTSILIGIIELFTRFIFYFFHERIWNKVNWGKRKSQQGW